MDYFFQSQDQNARYSSELFPEEGNLMQNKERKPMPSRLKREERKKGRRKDGRKKERKKERKVDMKIKN